MAKRQTCDAPLSFDLEFVQYLLILARLLCRDRSSKLYVANE